ncbi:hypothetical protein EH228_12245 [Erwinia endophytica]|uniref:Ail/Lom family outer membrane beta-barrel protein n=1 Tax=Erwinia endophytica TaxID=1563158 RepID=UPI001265F544|nr:Ail/Lom family outer membrane beta-barrel protein [Erwinia endophytica]KAB8310065.1 hypothetical protein EH228_12245 [Erwinia endophytica]
MNQLTCSAILLVSVAFSPLASANNQTVTLGFAQSKLQNVGNIEGVNLKYRYEWDSPFSIISSFTYMSDTFNYTYFDYDNDKMDHHAKLTYYSLAVGPAYRFNDYISLYGLVGLNYNKGKARTRWNKYETGGSYSDMGNLYY